MKAPIESKHTRGEWRRAHPYIISNNNGRDVDICRINRGRLSSAEMDANATILSLAPAMFDALRLIANGTHPLRPTADSPNGNQFEDAQALAQSILSKLTCK